MLLATLLAQSLLLGPYYVSLKTSADPTVRVMAAGRTVWEGVPSKHLPWKLAGGDIDGNGWPDFAVGVFKSTDKIPHRHRTVFFYEIRDGRVLPKWKGSSLGSPLVDFAYARGGEGPRLVAIQRRMDLTLGLFVWKWSGFGFRLERHTGRWKEAHFGEIHKGSVQIRTESGPVWVKLEP